MDLNKDIEKKFGAKLAYIRKSKRLSQMKLAEIVNMNFNYILNKQNATLATVQAYNFQKKKSLIINTIISALIFIASIIMGIKTGERMMFLISIVCIIRVISLFYAPYSDAKISSGAFYENKEFNFELIENGAAITPKDKERKEILFEDAKAFETKNFFIITLNSRFYPIPKEFMEKEQILELSEVISKTFSNKK